MLTLQQRPRMGSSQPSDGNLPFGWQIHDSQEYPYFDAPAPDPPQGPPVLSSDDSGRLEDFFQGFDSNSYNFAFGEGLNFSDAWLNNLPPTFMGTTTSFGHQNSQLDNLASPHPGMPATTLPDAYNFGQHMMPPQHHMPQQQHRPAPPMAPETATQADVAAVLAALQNGHPNNPLSRGSAVGSGTHLPSHPLISPTDNARPVSQVKTQRKRSPVRPNPVDSNHFRSMMFGNVSGDGPTTQRMNEAPDLQWGSDPSFAKPQGFIPPSREDTQEVLEQKRIGYLQCLEISKSAATTRPPSPVGSGESATPDTQNGRPSDRIPEEAAALPSPTKRRKSDPKEEVDEENDRLSPIPAKPPAKKRKSKADGSGAAETGSSASKEGAGKRRRSAANASKTPRENLTEAQKRENHIKSEQKRRGAIKEGYQELGSIVPNLSSSGYSKSMMLTMAADWLEELIKGNEELANR